MSLGKCLPDLVASGKLRPETGQELQSLFDELERTYKRQFGEQAAADMASEDTLKYLERETLRKKRQMLLQVRAQNQALLDFKRYDGGSYVNDPLPPRAVEALFDRDGRAPYSNVEARRKAIRGQAHAMIAGILEQHRRNVIGVLRYKAELDEIGRAAFGEAVESANAREMADAWTRTAEWLRRRFNAAGGDIGKLDRWGLPQSHDGRAVRAAGYRAWRDFIKPLLDRERMIDQRIGKPFTDESLELALREVFETIRTDGWSKRKAGGATGAKSLANRHADHRFLHFRNYDGWSAYAERFGAGTAFDAMLGHVEAMARDIAMVEILGPNPAATTRWLKDLMMKQAQLSTDPGSKAIDTAFAGGKRVQRLYDEISGANWAPESRKIALTFSSLRSLQTAAKLGSATLSAVTDIGFQVATRKFNGLPAVNTLGQYLKMLNPLDQGDKMLAVRAGLIAEEWGTMAAAQSRYLNEELTGEVARRMAETTLRASGLSAFTQAGRWAFGMEFVSALTNYHNRSWDQIDAPFRSAMERHGFNAASWERIRATPLVEERGSLWLLPTEIEDQALSSRVLEMILSETDFAVPTADLRTRALFNGVAPRGNLAGEIIRSALLFKSFGVSVLLTHGSRMMEQQGAWNRFRYAAGLTIALSIGGAVAMQLKELSKGKDPLPMTDPAFAWKAMLQGGGFGIFGDFVNATENRFGGGLASTLAGPLVQTAGNVGYAVNDFAGSAIAPRAEDRKKRKHAFQRDLTRLLRQEVPGSSIWWLRTAYEREMVDQIEEAIDPDYRKHFRDIQRRAEKQGNDYFWAPGERTPERAPDWKNIMASGGGG